MENEDDFTFSAPQNYMENEDDFIFIATVQTVSGTTIAKSDFHSSIRKILFDFVILINDSNLQN